MNDEELIAAACELYAAPPDERFAHLTKDRTRLCEHPFDQKTPEGISNPYWEIVRQMPTDTVPWEAMPSVHGHWFASSIYPKLIELGLMREPLVRRYSWSIPSPGDIQWIKEQLEGRGVVEIGAGTGYWAWQMQQVGIDVIAYDLHKPKAENVFAQHGPYHPIRYGGTPKAAQHPDRALFLSWPTYADRWAYRALNAYQGDLLIHAGEDWGGCTADDSFWRLLNRKWDEVSYSPLHVTYFGIHCRLTAWRRK